MPTDLEDRRDDVDAVGELRAQVAAGLDPARPRDDHRVARAAQVAGHLLAPLERGVVGVGPRRREVRRGVEAAEVLDAAELLDDRELLARRSRTTPLKNVVSLNDPVSVPSMLAPLSPQM